MVSQSRNFDEFVAILRADGYAVKTEGKYLAVRPPGKERFTRLRRLGDSYTEEALRARILDSRENTAPEVPIGQMAQSSPRARHGRYAGRFGSPTRPKVRGLRALYLWYAYRMGNIHEHLPTREYYGGIERAYHELGLTEEIAGVLEPALARARHRAKMRRGTRSGK